MVVLNPVLLAEDLTALDITESHAKKKKIGTYTVCECGCTDLIKE